MLLDKAIGFAFQLEDKQNVLIVTKEVIKFMKRLEGEDEVFIENLHKIEKERGRLISELYDKYDYANRDINFLIKRIGKALSESMNSEIHIFIIADCKMDDYQLGKVLRSWNKTSQDNAHIHFFELGQKNQLLVGISETLISFENLSEKLFEKINKEIDG